MKQSFFALCLVTTVLSANSYEQWLQSQNSQYTQYKKSLDEEFSDMLKKEWSAYKGISTPPAYKKPKPVVVPAVTTPIKMSPEEIKESPVVTVAIPKKVVISEPIVPVKKTVVPKNFDTAHFTFYSLPMSINYDINTYYTNSKIDKNAISSFWDMMSKTDFKKLIAQIELQQKNLQLNDWAMYQLVYQLGKTIFKNNNSANLFTWFTLVKMGFDTKVGYSNDTIYLLSTIEQRLFQVSFFILNDKKYYVLTPDGKNKKVKNIYTYQGEYPKASNLLSFKFHEPIKLDTNIQKKPLYFTYEKQNYTLYAQYSDDLINFYKTFPQSDYRLYFDTKNSTALGESLLVQLAPLLEGKSEIEAVNFLLRFVQTAFDYKTDQNQFDYEKVMFPEETIKYPFSDCEDRSILLSYLVKNLLKLDVVGVKYADHLATAVAFSSPVSGDGFSYKNTQYTLCDGTYINANVGVSMPQYKNKNFQIISLR